VSAFESTVSAVTPEGAPQLDETTASKINAELTPIVLGQRRSRSDIAAN
jgi:hypothetical protein